MTPFQRHLWWIIIIFMLVVCVVVGASTGWSVEP